MCTVVLQGWSHLMCGWTSHPFLQAEAHQVEPTSCWREQLSLTNFVPSQPLSKIGVQNHYIFTYFDITILSTLFINVMKNLSLYAKVYLTPKITQLKGNIMVFILALSICWIALKNCCYHMSFICGKSSFLNIITKNM